MASRWKRQGFESKSRPTLLCTLLAWINLCTWKEALLTFLFLQGPFSSPTHSNSALSLVWDFRKQKPGNLATSESPLFTPHLKLGSTKPAACLNEGIVVGVGDRT